MVHRTVDGAYWNAQAKAGLLINAAICTIHVAYGLATWSERPFRNSALLLGLNVAVLVATAVTTIAMPAPRLSAASRREPLFYAWCLGGSLFICVAVVLDGGPSSPLAWLFIMNVAMTGLVHPWPLILCATVSASAGLVVASLLDDATVDAPSLALRLVYLAAVGYLALVTSGARWKHHDEQVAVMNSLADLVERDPMTRLLNHAAFHDRLAEELARAERRQSPLSLLVADLDHFKAVNDSHGHRTGDEALARVAHLLRVMARRGDIAARIGGEEFCLLLPETDYPAAVAVAERLRRSVATLTDPVRVTISVGVSTFPGVAPTPDSLFESADRSLYEAKRAGRNRVGQPGPG